MTSRTRGRALAARLAAVTAAAALMGGVFAAAPAQADETMSAHLEFPGVALAPGEFEEYLELEMLPDSDDLELFENYDLTIDTSEVSNWATVEPRENEDCTQNGNLITCRGFAWVDDGSGNSMGQFSIRADKAAVPVQRGNLHFSVEFEGFEPLSLSSPVTLAHPTDLAAGVDTRLEVAYGDSFEAPIAVANLGDTPVEGAVLRFYAHTFTQIESDFINCEFDQYENLLCRIDGTLEPGVAYELTGLMVGITEDAAAPGYGVAYYQWWTIADYEAYYGGAPAAAASATGDVLTLKESGDFSARSHTDIDQENNSSFMDIDITGNNPRNAAAFGDTATGKAGDTVTVTVGAENVGNSTFKNLAGDDVFQVFVAIPAGTTAVAVPDSCYNREDLEEEGDPWGRPGYKEYTCGTSYYIEPGEKFGFEFELKLDKTVSNAIGEVRLQSFDGGGSPIKFDETPDNDVAKLVINPTNPDGSLPVTGTSLTVWVSVGAAAILAAIVGMVLVRRRKAAATW